MQVLAAVDAERLARDERRAIADEEHNGARHLSRPRESPNGDPGHDLLEDFGGTAATIAVSVYPAAITLTVMPRAALSSASALVKPIMPALAAA